MALTLKKFLLKPFFPISAEVRLHGRQQLGELLLFTQWFLHNELEDGLVDLGAWVAVRVSVHHAHLVLAENQALLLVQLLHDWTRMHELLGLFDGDVKGCQALTKR